MTFLTLFNTPARLGQRDSQTILPALFEHFIRTPSSSCHNRRTRSSLIWGRVPWFFRGRGLWLSDGTGAQEFPTSDGSLGPLAEDTWWDHTMSGWNWMNRNRHQPQSLLLNRAGWMICICRTAESNSKLETTLGTATGATLDIFKGYPNLQPGKIAMLVTPRGRGACQWKRRLWGPLADAFITSLGEHHSYQVPLVTEYIHLGGKVRFSTVLKKKIRTRMGQAHQEFNKHRRLMTPLSEPALWDCEAQGAISQSDSEQVSFWIIKDQKTKDYLHGGIIRLLKRLLRCPADSRISDEEVLCKTGISSPTKLLRLRRLRSLGSLMALEKTATWGLLNRDRDWISLVQDDFRWPLQTWMSTFRAGAQEHPIGVAQRNFLVRSAHHIFLQTLASGNFIQPQEKKPDDPLIRTEAFGCMRCKLRCRTIGGGGAHMNRVHGEVHPVRSLIRGKCMVCLREYLTGNWRRSWSDHTIAAALWLDGGYRSPLNGDLDPAKTQPDCLLGTIVLRPCRQQVLCTLPDKNVTSTLSTVASMRRSSCSLWRMRTSRTSSFACGRSPSSGLFHGLAAGSRCRRLGDRLRQAFNSWCASPAHCCQCLQHLAASLRIFLISLPELRLWNANRPYPDQ